MRIIYQLSFILFFINWGCNQNECLCLEVEDSYEIPKDRLISMNLDIKKNTRWTEEMVLVKKSNNGKQMIPHQLETSDKTKIWFLHNSNGSKTSYCFEKLSNQNSPTLFHFQKQNGDLKLKNNKQSLIHYRYEMKNPPEGVSPLYQKSGYIHPVISPKGDTLSRIQPPDHYHHYGVWGPWTRTKIDDVGVDFWNLKDGQGTVLFKKFKQIDNGNVYTGFTALQEHINLTQKEPQVALNEKLNVKVWKNKNPNQYFIDYTSQFNTPLEEGVLFEAYRYGGGLGFRFKEQWNKDNCEVITSEGKNRTEADGTSARWCMVKGVNSNGDGSVGILFLSHPNNRSHPEPMRVWPLNANKGRGDMFFEFCPIRHKEWKIEPQKSYELKYRMLVFDGSMTPTEAQQHWMAFAYSPKIIF